MGKRRTRFKAIENRAGRESAPAFVLFSAFFQVTIRG